MSTLGRAVIELSAETVKFTGDMGRAAAMFEKNMAAMQRSVDGLLGKIGIAGGVAGVGLMVKGAIDLADNTYKASQKIGITTDKLSELTFAFQLADVEQGTLVKGLAKFEQAMIAAGNSSSKEAKVFKALGVDLTKGPYEAFLQTADAISQLPKESEVAAAAMRALFGKGGLDLTPGMMQGRAGIEEMSQKARNLGLVISEDLGRASEQFNDNMKILRSTSSSLGITLAREVLPVLTDITSELSKAAEKGRGAFASSLLQQVNKIGAATVTGAYEALGLKLDPRVQAAMEAAFQPDQRKVAGKLRSAPGAPAPAVGPEISPEQRAARERALREALASNEAQQKREAAALQSMEEKKKTLFNLDERQLMMDRITTGSYADFTAATKKKLMAIAAEIDARKQKIDVIEAEYARERELFKRQEDSGNALESYFTASQDLTRQFQFETSMVGKLTTEQERLNAMHQVDVELRQKIRELSQIHADDPEGLRKATETAEAIARRRKEALGTLLDEKQQAERNRTMATRIEQIQHETEALTMNARQLEIINALRALDIEQYGRVLTEQERSILLTEKDLEQRQRLIDAIANRQKVERDWSTGAQQAFRDYADAATNAAANAQQAFSRAFQNLEDALVKFVQTGKLDFKSLADSIIADLIRIQIRASITGPLAQAMGANGGMFGGGGGFFGNLFGFGKGGLETVANPVAAIGMQGFASGTDYVPRDMIARIHKGERIIPATENFRDSVGSSGPAMVIHADMRGADVEAVKRLEAFVARMDASLESRAVNAVFDQQLRGNRV